MMKMPRIILSLAVVVVACSDGATSVPSKASPNQPAYTKGGASADLGINGIVDALNAAWAAKDAAGYAAPFATDAQVITPVGTILSGRAAIQARHTFLFAGPLAASTQIVSIQRLQFLSGTIAIADGQSVITNGTVVTTALVRWVLTKNGSDWEIAGQQSTTIP
jgi:uncharacterized protein (TIGR02246 family)